MNESKALCPGCKTETVFADAGGGVRKCLSCGFQFSASPAPPPVYPAASSGIEEAFRILIKAFLIMLAVAVVGLAVAFAGCAILLSH